MSHPLEPGDQPTGVGRTVAIAVGLVGVLAVLVLAFLWPAVTSQPRNVPVAITGPQPAVQAVGAALGQQEPGVVELTTVADRDAAVAAIESRDAVGAIVLGEAPEVLTAGAAGTQLSQAMTTVADQLEQSLQAQADAAAAGAGQTAPRVSVTVTDVVPLAADDPHGSGFMVGMFPVVIGGILGGIGLSVAISGPRRRSAAVLVYAAVAGLVLALVLRSWFGTLQGSWWAQAAATGLTLAAIAGPIAGLFTWLRWPGLPIGAVLMLLVGNPLSGVMIPQQFLPEPWGAVGQWLPPGATATLLRDLSYFPQAGTAFPWAVLGAWALVGLGLCAVGRDAAAPAPVATPALVAAAE